MSAQENETALTTGEILAEEIPVREGVQKIYTTGAKITKIEDHRPDNFTEVVIYKYAYDADGRLSARYSSPKTLMTGPSIDRFLYLKSNGNNFAFNLTYYKEREKALPANYATAMFPQNTKSDMEFAFHKDPVTGYSHWPFIPGSYEVRYSWSSETQSGNRLYVPSSEAKSFDLIDHDSSYKHFPVSEIPEFLHEYLQNGSLPTIEIPPFNFSEIFAEPLAISPLKLV